MSAKARIDSNVDAGFFISTTANPTDAGHPGFLCSIDFR